MDDHHRHLHDHGNHSDHGDDTHDAQRSRELRAALVAQLQAQGMLTHTATARAFLRVPRERFLPGVDLDHVYRDEAIITKREGGVNLSSSSQPTIMARMLEMLHLQPGMRVLEIGAGTGYNAALLHDLVGEDGRVVSIDIDAEVADWARTRLDAAGYAAVEVIAADGADGWPDGASWDAISVTVGVPDIAVAWTEQLATGGRLVLPLQIGNGQLCIAFQRAADGSLHSEALEPCGFVPMRGRLAAEQPLRILPNHLLAGSPDDVPTDTLSALLALRPTCAAWDGNLWDGFVLLAAMQGVPLFPLWAEPPRQAEHDADTAPALHDRFTHGAFALYVAGDPATAVPPSLATLAPSQTTPGQTECCAWGGPAAAQRLQLLHARWVALGRPAAADLHLIAQRAAATTQPPDTPDGHALIIDTAAWRLLVTRRDGGALA